MRRTCKAGRGSEAASHAAPTLTSIYTILANFPLEMAASGGQVEGLLSEGFVFSPSAKIGPGHPAPRALPVAGKLQNYLLTFPGGLPFEFWVNEGANSGVFLRVPGRDVAIDQRTAVEVNISDTHKTWPTGSINEVGRVPVTPATINQWNRYEITADGSHIVVALNGATTVDVRDPRHTRGPVGVQYCCRAGNIVRFRNIELRPLPR